MITEQEMRVLRAAKVWAMTRRALGTPVVHPANVELVAAVDALEESKGVPPEMCEPGTRFCFAKTPTRRCGYGGMVVRARFGRAAHRCAPPLRKCWMSDDFTVAEFTEDDRLIPIESDNE